MPSPIITSRPLSSSNLLAGIRRNVALGMAAFVLAISSYSTTSMKLLLLLCWSPCCLHWRSPVSFQIDGTHAVMLHMGAAIPFTSYTEYDIYDIGVVCQVPYQVPGTRFIRGLRDIAHDTSHVRGTISGWAWDCQGCTSICMV